jgi:hypothetical protein
MTPAHVSAAGSAAFTLASSLSAHMSASCASGGGSASVASGAMAMNVACGAAAAGAPINVSGTSAAVDPLPAALMGGGSVLTQFMALAFDPFLNATNTSGVTSLQLQDASSGSGAAVPVAASSALITLTLPAAAAPGGHVASAAFWNATLQAYSSAGLVTIPNPAPAAVTLNWVLNFSATSDDVLPLAWVAGGAAAAGCTDASLDCSVPAQRRTAVQLCAINAAAPSWSGCGDQTSGIFRMWSGCACALWQDTSCSWNISTQSFQGAACVSANTTRVATRHLTSFTAQASPPQIKTLSAADLVAISPEDIVHLRNLVIIIGVLFVGMHAGAWVLARIDKSDFNRLLALARSPEAGCTAIDVGGGETLLTWRFTQDKLEDDKRGGVVAGSAVVFAGIMGVPYARLACAVPETMLGGQPPRHCIGLPAGMSPETAELPLGRLSEGAEHHEPLECALDGEQPPPDSPLPPLTLTSAPVECTAEEVTAFAPAAPGPTSSPDISTMTGTALMHALQLSWCMASGEDIVAQQRLFIRQFAPADMAAQAAEFLRLFTVFKEMLISGTLRSGKNWLPKARLWRTILLANDAGCWEPSDALAFALLANNQAHPPSALQGFQMVTAALSNLAGMLLGNLLTGDATGAGQEIGGAAALAATARRAYKQRAQRRKAQEAGTELDAGKDAEAEARPAGGFIDDGESMLVFDDGEEGSADGGDPDPLSFTADAILHTLPPELAAALPGDTALAARIWTTTLVAAFLESNTLFCWRITPASTPADEQRTLLDAAQDWLDATLAGLPASDAEESAAVDGAHVALLARAQIARWAAFHDRRVTASRGARIGTRQHLWLRAYYACSYVNSTVTNGHPTFSLFASELLIGFTRWMGAHVLVSAIMAMLVVNIWFCARPSLWQRLPCVCLPPPPPRL